jgi:hypothetical protein
MRRGVLHGSLIKGAGSVHWVAMPKKWQKLADSVRPLRITGNLKKFVKVKTFKLSKLGYPIIQYIKKSGQKNVAKSNSKVFSAI